MQDLKEIKIWNIKYNLLSVDEIVEIVNQWLDEGRKGIHLTGANVETVASAQDDVLLREAIMDSDIVNVDSFLPTKFIQRKGYDFKHRAASPDVFEELMKRANERGQTVFFLGAKQDTLDKLRVVLEREYPNMIIAGMHNGFYNDEEEENIIQQISNLKPDFLFVALPSPRKERLIMNYKHIVKIGVLYGVGGAFDAKAGVLSRPPKYLRGFAGEAFFRVLRSPKVMGARWPLYYNFIKMALKDKKK